MANTLSKEEDGALFSLTKPEADAVIPKRLTVRLSDEMRDWVAEIIEETSARNTTDALHSALQVYHRLIIERKAGNKTYLEVKEDNKSRKIPIFA